MSKLAELLAAEQTTKEAWTAACAATAHAFSKGDEYVGGHTRTLNLINDSPDREHLQNAAREHKPVRAVVIELLQHALAAFTRNEQLQAEKNATNAAARGTVLWLGKPILKDVPIDELLGLEARFTAIRTLIAAVPVLDGARTWVRFAGRRGLRVVETPDVSVKTDKVPTPLTLAPATPQHPANVTVINKDVPAGAYTLTRFSGAVPEQVKNDALERVNTLLIEIKQARQRANETPVVKAEGVSALVDLVLAPFIDDL